jgi:hypothetical protein
MNSLSRRVTSEAAIALLCLALTFIFFHSAVFPQISTFLCGYDNTYQYYPWMHKLADDWRALAPPLWDFSVEAGFPFSGEWNTAAFYPINILYVWLTGIPTPVKLDVLILFHFAAAMWGISLFLRQRGVERWPESIWRRCVLLGWAGCNPCFRTSQYFRGIYLLSVGSLFF